MTPRLDAGFGPAAVLHADAYARALQVYRREAPDAVLAEGALQLPQTDRDLDRFRAAAAWDHFRPGGLEVLCAEAATARLGEPAPRGGLLIADALVLDPLRACGRFAGEVEPRRVTRIEVEPSGAGLFDGVEALFEADVICLASGWAVEALAGPLGVRLLRGQSTTVVGSRYPGLAVTGGGYAAPTRDGIVFGATHDRGDGDEAVRALDHERNLVSLARFRPELAKRLERGPFAGRAGVRAGVADHLPLAGRLGEGVFVLAGLGGRGFTLAPYLADALAAEALGAPPLLSPDLKRRLAPARFSGAA